MKEQLRLKVATRTTMIHEKVEIGDAIFCKQNKTTYYINAETRSPFTIGSAKTALEKPTIPDGYVESDGGLFVVPTVDPAVAGALWNDTGVLSISAG